MADDRTRIAVMRGCVDRHVGMARSVPASHEHVNFLIDG
jgi:hypothetical protein